MTRYLMITVLLFLAWIAPAHAQPVEQLGQSRYYLKGKTVYYLEDGKTPLAAADAATFVPHIRCPHPYRYGIALAADKNAFYLHEGRIPFRGASKSKLIACFSHGDCMHLVLHRDTLYRINQNEKSVQRVATVGKGLAPIATGDDAIAPGYLRDGKRVYFYDIHKNKLRALDQVSRPHFEAHAARYSFTLHWGRDGRRVYVGHQRIRGADARSFQYLGWVYAKDKARVYRLSSENEPAWFAIPDADPKSFRPVKGRGIDACDDKRCYSLGKRRAR